MISSSCHPAFSEIMSNQAVICGRRPAADLRVTASRVHIQPKPTLQYELTFQVTYPCCLQSS